MLAEQTGAPTAVPGLLSYLTDRWDGHGPLGRGRHEGIPLAMRIVHVATDAALQRHLGGIEHAVSIVRERAGHAFDPEVAACLVEGGREILALDDGGSAWDEALAVEPAPPLMLEDDAARPRARRDGPLRRPDLAVPGRSFDRASPSSHPRRRALPDRRRGGDARSGAPASSTISAGSRSTRGSGRSPVR